MTKAGPDDEKVEPHPNLGGEILAHWLDAYEAANGNQGLIPPALQATAVAILNRSGKPQHHRTELPGGQHAVEFYGQALVVRGFFLATCPFQIPTRAPGLFGLPPQLHPGPAPGQIAVVPVPPEPKVSRLMPAPTPPAPVYA